MSKIGHTTQSLVKSARVLTYSLFFFVFFLLKHLLIFVMTKAISNRNTCFKAVLSWCDLDYLNITTLPCFLATLMGRETHSHGNYIRW